MKLNVYKFEVVIRKTVKIAAQSESLARTCLIEREDYPPEPAVLIEVQKNVDVKKLTAESVDCISFTDGVLESAA